MVYFCSATKSTTTTEPTHEEDEPIEMTTSPEETTKTLKASPMASPGKEKLEM